MCFFPFIIFMYSFRKAFKTESFESFSYRSRGNKRVLSSWINIVVVGWWIEYFFCWLEYLFENISPPHPLSLSLNSDSASLQQIGFLLTFNSLQVILRSCMFAPSPAMSSRMTGWPRQQLVRFGISRSGCSFDFSSIGHTLRLPAWSVSDLANFQTGCVAAAAAFTQGQKSLQRRFDSFSSTLQLPFLWIRGSSVAMQRDRER